MLRLWGVWQAMIRQETTGFARKQKTTVIHLVNTFQYGYQLPFNWTLIRAKEILTLFQSCQIQRAWIICWQSNIVV